MAASLLLIIVGPAACAVEITFFKNTEIAPPRKAEIATLNTSSQKNPAWPMASCHGAAPNICFQTGRASYFFAPNVNPRPVVNMTLFFLLPGTGWLTY